MFVIAASSDMPRDSDMTCSRPRLTAWAITWAARQQLGELRRADPRFCEAGELIEGFLEVALELPLAVLHDMIDRNIGQERKVDRVTDLRRGSGPWSPRKMSPMPQMPKAAIKRTKRIFTIQGAGLGPYLGQHGRWWSRA